MDDQRSERTLPGDRVMWVHVFISVVAGLVVYMRILEIAGCTDRCDYSAIGSSTQGFWWTDLVVFVVAIGSYFFFRTRIQRSWIIPTIGITLTLIAFVVANISMSSALGQF